MLETYRECLQDVFDLPALKRLLHGLQTRELDLVEVETPSASPFAASLLFDYVATYMYEDDTPPAERRAQALSLDRDLLRELLGQEELRDLLDAGGARRGRARSCAATRATPDELHDLLRRARRPARRRVRRRASPSRCCASGARCACGSAGEERLIAAEDAGRYRDALGAMPPGGLPDAFLEGGRRAAARARRALRARARAVHDRARRTSASAVDVEPELRGARARGAARPRRAAARRHASASGATPTCCAACAAPRSPRCAREVEPAEQAALGALPARRGTGIDRRATLREALVPLQALALPVVALGVRGAAAPRARLPAGAARPALRDRARSSGSARASTASRSTSARTRRCSAGRPARRAPEGEAHDAIRAALGASAEFWFDLLAATGLEAEAALPALWELVWAGEVTNDAWTPLRAGAPLRRAAAPSGARAASRAAGRSAITATQGRWSLTDRLFARRGPTGARSPSCCSSGRGSSRATASAARGSPAATAPSTASCARSRRSASAGAATSSRGSAAPSSRSAARSSGCASCAAATRTTSRARSCSPPPIRRSRTARRCRGRSAPVRRAARVAGAHVVLLGGEAGALRRARRPLARPAARAGRGAGCGRRWRRSSSTCGAAARKRLAVERFDGEPVAETEVMPLLVEAGFLAGPRRAVLRP